MSSFCPPPPPPTRDLGNAGGLNVAPCEGLSQWTLSKLKLLVQADKQPDAVHLALGGLVVSVSGLIALGIVSALPPQGKAFVVSVGAFAYPALATTAELGSGYKEKPPAYMYYWVSLANVTKTSTGVVLRSGCSSDGPVRGETAVYVDNWERVVAPDSTCRFRFRGTDSPPVVPFNCFQGDALCCIGTVCIYRTAENYHLNTK